MKLSEKRKMFTYFLGKLIEFINTVDGYSCFLGDVMARDGHCNGSFHYQGLAADINLFFNNEYLTKTEDHEFLGIYWKSLHPLCTWGGDFRHKDGNHYSFGEGVRK